MSEQIFRHLTFLWGSGESAQSARKYKARGVSPGESAGSPRSPRSGRQMQKRFFRSRIFDFVRTNERHSRKDCRRPRGLNQRLTRDPGADAPGLMLSPASRATESGTLLLTFEVVCRVDVKVFSRLGEFEGLSKFILTHNPISLSGAPTRWNVLDGL